MVCPCLRLVNTERAEARGHGEYFEIGLRIVSSIPSTYGRIAFP